MSKIVLQPTITADWHLLVQEAEQSMHVHLAEDVESYLIFLLTRFMRKPEMANSVLALEFLQSMHPETANRDQLRDVGDKCLLFAGLFPGRAERRRVKISYFVNLGQSAYTALAGVTQQKIAELYEHLGQAFVLLMDVLQVIREQSAVPSILTPIQAEELWRDVSSEHALRVLRRHTNGVPLFFDIKNQKSKIQ